MLTPWRGGEFRYRVWLLLTSSHPQPLSKSPGNPKQLGPPGMRLSFLSVPRIGATRDPLTHTPTTIPKVRLCLLWGKFPLSCPRVSQLHFTSPADFPGSHCSISVITGDLLSALIMNLREQGGTGRSEVLAPFLVKTDLGLLLRRCRGQGPHLGMMGESRGFSQGAAGFSRD